MTFGTTLVYTSLGAKGLKNHVSTSVLKEQNVCKVI